MTVSPKVLFDTIFAAYTGDATAIAIYRCRPIGKTIPACNCPFPGVIHVYPK
jgi:hypothetical protein